MPFTALEDLFLHELRHSAHAGTEWLRVLPKMAQAAASDSIRHGFEEQLQRTRTHVGRLNQMLEQAGESAGGTKGETMVRLITEGHQTIAEDAAPRTTDADLISAAQRVDQLAVAGYDTACSCARLLGHRDAERLLKQTLHELQDTDEPLRELADCESGAETIVISTVFGDVCL